MFTIKLYSDLGSRIRIMTAESFTVLQNREGWEITLHQKNQLDDNRFDIKEPWPEAKTSDEQREQWPVRFQRAIIENELGKTTDIFQWTADASRNAPANALAA